MKPDKNAFPDDVSSAPGTSVRTPPITIDKAVEALDVDGRHYAPSDVQ